MRTTSCGPTRWGFQSLKLVVFCQSKAAADEADILWPNQVGIRFWLLSAVYVAALLASQGVCCFLPTYLPSAAHAAFSGTRLMQCWRSSSVAADRRLRLPTACRCCTASACCRTISTSNQLCPAGAAPRPSAVQRAQRLGRRQILVRAAKVSVSCACSCHLPNFLGVKGGREATQATTCCRCSFFHLFARCAPVASCHMSLPPSPLREDVEEHRDNLLRLAAERGYRRGWCWHMLRLRWGEATLRGMGLEKL